jgi:hypothetical protein
MHLTQLLLLVPALLQCYGCQRCRYCCRINQLRLSHLVLVLPVLLE